LPSRADLCIAELVGNIGGSEGIVAILRDARKRHLAPGAQVIPSWVGSRVAAVCLADLLGEHIMLNRDFLPYVEAVMRSVESAFDLRFCVTGMVREDLMSDSSLLEDLRLSDDLYEYPETVSLRIRQTGHIDGLAVWLQLRCAPGHPMLDSLDQRTNWLPVYIPFDVDEPIEVEENDRLVLHVQVKAADDIHPEYGLWGFLDRRAGTRIPVRGVSPYGTGQFRQSWLHRQLFHLIAE
jgi:protein arginine N-methyltransferase 1